MRQSLQRTQRGGTIEVVLAVDLEPDTGDVEVRGLPQYDGVMVSFLEPAQIQGIARLLGHHEPERFDPEGFRQSEVAHVAVDIRDADHIERRIEIGRSNGHAVPYIPIGGTLCVSSATQIFLVSM